MKSEGDFAEILSQDNPDIWRSNKPAQGGETGAMFDKIIAQAMQMKAGGSGVRGSGSGVRKTKAARATKAKTAKKAATRTAKPKARR